MEDNAGEAIKEIGEYRISKTLGEGSQGTTFLAKHAKTGQVCALKQMHMDVAEGWKSVELFEREAKVMSNLSHPSIPQFIEYFETHDEDRGLRLNLVQEFVSGSDLAKRVEGGELFKEDDIKRILQQLLDVLEYIHSHSPSVIHRDVKPSNIIITDDGRLVLVDFGAVQFKKGRGTTVVGTTGYMPPEQLMGHATPASDLYSAGATMIHIATRKHPADMPLDGLKLDWKDDAALSSHLVHCLDKLIEPDPGARPKSVEAVRGLLSTELTLGPIMTEAVHPTHLRSTLLFDKRRSSKLHIVQSADSIEIHVGLRTKLQKFRDYAGGPLAVALFMLFLKVPPFIIVVLILGWLFAWSRRPQTIHRISFKEGEMEVTRSVGRDVSRNAFRLGSDIQIETDGQNAVRIDMKGDGRGRQREVLIPGGILDSQDRQDLTNALKKFLAETQSEAEPPFWSVTPH